MSGEHGIEQPGYGAGITPLERVVMASVYLAVICFLLWFFFLAGAPLGATRGDAGGRRAPAVRP